MNKSLKEKAVSIKGKSYVLVADRVIYFNENYPNGSIQTEIILDKDSGRYEAKSKVYPDIINAPARIFTGHSQAIIGEGYINKTAALENCETSAVGRALALMGIGVIDSIASVDEINKAERQSKKSESLLVCDTCGKPALISPKSQRPYCPDWREHKDKGEKTTMIMPKDADSKVDKFFKDMGDEPTIQQE